MKFKTVKKSFLLLKKTSRNSLTAKLYCIFAQTRSFIVMAVAVFIYWSLTDFYLVVYLK